MLGNLTIRFVQWLWRSLVRRSGLYGIFMIAVLQATLVFVTLGLREAVGGLAPIQGRLFWLIFAGILLGRWSGMRKHWWVWILLSTSLAVPVIFLFMGDLGAEIIQLLDALYDLGLQFFSHIYDRLPADEFIPPDNLQIAWLNFSLEAWTYADDVRIWVLDLQAGRTPGRVSAVAFVWGAVMYMVSIWASAILRRSKNVLLAMLPSGAVLVMTLAFARVDHFGYLVMYLCGALVLHAGATQFENEQRWEKNALDYPLDMRVDFSVSSSVLIGGIVIAAFIVPQLNLRTFLRGLMGLDRPGIMGPASDDGLLGDSLGIVRPTPLPPYFDFFQAGGMPRSHLIGMPPEEQFKTVLKIQVTGPVEFADQQYYWRSLTYDSYIGSGWVAGETKTVRYNRGVEVPLEDYPFALTIRQQVEVVDRSGELAFAAGDIYSIDKRFEVAWYPPVGETFDAFGTRVQEDLYTVDSQYPVQHALTLRNAGTEYPDWVINRYLSLPGSVPQRVRDLAAEITSGLGTPYEKAKALERYLRQYEYSLNVSAPPGGSDIVDYFLFELQRGYCDYYSTSMVVMARSLGLPARLAIGYAQGRYDQAEALYYIIGQDAHSWPEIYFPGFGWVPFEPTAGVVAIGAMDQDLPPVFDQVELPPLIQDNVAFWPLLSRAFGFALAAGVVLLLGWVVFDQIRQLRQTPEMFFEEVIQRLYARSRRLKIPLPVRATPTELSDGLAAYMSKKASESAFLQRFPGTNFDLALLRDKYNQFTYSPAGIKQADKNAGIKAWRALRMKIWFFAAKDRLAANKRKK